MEVTQLVEWTRAAFPYAGDSVLEKSPDGLPEPEASALRVVSACEMFEKKENAEEVLFTLAFGLNGLGSYLLQSNKDAARKTFANVFLALTSFQSREAQSVRFKKAIGFAFGNFKGAGGEEPSIASAPESAYLDLTAVLQAVLPDVDEGVQPVEGVEMERRPEKPASSLGLLERLRSSWTAPVDHKMTSDALTELRQYLKSQLDRSNILARDLGVIFDADSQDLSSSGMLESLPLHSGDLQDVAREFRRFAFDRSADQAERRRRWLIAALVNHTLLQMPDGLPTNGPQVQIDLMGYVSAIQMDHRYRDADRDLLLDCAEAEVRLANNMAPIVLNRFSFIREWLLSSIGTYLILAGPNPSRPSDNYYDERIHSDTAPAGRGLGRARRQEWPEMLLENWQQHVEMADGACFAIASLSGWDLARSRWVVDRIYDASNDPQRELSREDLQKRLSDLLSRVERVRIATNPWRAAEPTASRGTMITSDASGRFIIPDGLLKAAVAQGLKTSEAATVQGHMFTGRRVPTYLLTNMFGPFAILKIDQSEKVLREVRNFESYAKRRLHPSYRPSECSASEMDMYSGEDGTPLRAVMTSYVFEEQDEPLTLGSWLRTAEPSLAVETVERFLLRSLRPWLAHVRRDRVDIRSEYPVLRPAPAPGKQAPGRWARAELESLENPEVAKAIGMALSRETRDCPWFESLDGAGAVRKAGLLPGTLVNPLWLARGLAELGNDELSGPIDSLGLRDFDTLLCLSHGDMHLNNVLCASAAKSASPRVVLIDFESTHEGHVCKDIARMEASVLSQVFDVSTKSAEALSTWFAGSIRLGGVFAPSPDRAAGREVETMTSVAAKLRWVVQQCGQGHWPIREDEYLLAVFAALLPMVRWTTLSDQQRRLALVLATLAGSALVGP